ncbi:uncharacterized protein LOC119102836 [Pollicipes pollicipes]|uniref:uncharacterized protein LOC119102836 n=1 Tax=Pollicipes pollicipes TaxID=41117 RepID=UPI0018858FEE|nr:uncharacterized protein LOC119102836 [Pollicipes pollicipes]
MREACGRAAVSERWQRVQQQQVEHMLSGDSAADLRLSQLLFVDLVATGHERAPVMLCVTPSDMLLMECDLRWLVPGNGQVKIPMRDREKVANIVGVELLGGADAGRPSLRLLFRDAGSAAEAVWSSVASDIRECCQAALRGGSGDERWLKTNLAALYTGH